MILKVLLNKYVINVVLILSSFFIMTCLFELIQTVTNYHFIAYQAKTNSLLREYASTFISDFYRDMVKGCFSFLKDYISSKMLVSYESFSQKIYDNYFYNTSLSYAIYFSFCFILMSIASHFERFAFLRKMNDLNGDFFREIKDNNALDYVIIEKQLIFTNIYLLRILQTSIFASLSYLITPLFVLDYIIYISSLLNVPFLLFGENTYQFFFALSVQLEAMTLPLLPAMLLMLIFFKKNIFSFLLEKTIVNSFVAIYNINIRYAETNTEFFIERLNNFEDNDIKNKVLQQINKGNFA